MKVRPGHMLLRGVGARASEGLCHSRWTAPDPAVMAGLRLRAQIDTKICTRIGTKMIEPAGLFHSGNLSVRCHGART